MCTIFTWFLGKVMKLQFPFIQLPLLFEANVLAAEISALDEDAWRPHPQGFAGNSMLPLVAVDGDPDNESFAGTMRPTPHLQRCSYLQQVVASLGATVGRTRLMRLAGQAEVTRHADQGYYWAERVRVHVPVVTQPTVRFECGDAAINMAAGECWIFDTWRQHRVLNDATQSRIHLVCDTVGGGAFWDFVAQGRPHHVSSPGWQPRRVLPEAEFAADILCETVNVPVVMSPWELSSHLGFLLSETLPHPQLPVLQQRAAQLVRLWKGLWARYGESSEGREEYRAAFDAFTSAVRLPSDGVLLRNEIAWFSALRMMIGSAVVSPVDVGKLDAAGQRAMGDNA
jgi:Aspartyl/Asparaginyl beta-hydroxylase